ncbi:unnamed protein product [Euphydryas editha]|uniref:Uncharacterized protein n=1 Tax=Euphydryas editha TaxID=104508 RepID=A0AAU9TU21_EUPED|nr:unnamed protein product [Euphydryas editha]
MFTCASCGEQHTDGPSCSVYVNRASPRPLHHPRLSQLDRMQEQLNNIALQLKPLARLIEDVKYIREELNSLKDS